MLITRPTDITGCLAWFDATTGLYNSAVGGSLVTTDGGSIGRWEDQSGNNRHLIQTTVGDRPKLKRNNLDNKNTIQFNGINEWMSAVFSNTKNSTYAFIVLRDLSSTYTNSGLLRYLDTGFYDSNFTNFTNGCFLGVGTGDYSGNIGAAFTGPTNITSTTYTNTTNWTLYSYGRTIPNASTGYGEICANGVRIATRTGLNGTSNTPPVTVQQIIAGGHSTGFLNGFIAEIIIYDAPLSDEDRISVEVYLKNKWPSLPISAFSPASITGLQLWLDASDTTSLFSLSTEQQFFYQPGSQWLIAGNNSFGQLGQGDSGIGTERTSFTALTGQWNNLQITDNSLVSLSGVSTFVAGQDANSLFDVTSTTLLTQITGNWRKLLLNDNSLVALSTSGTIFVRGNNTGQVMGLGSTAPTTINTLTPLTGTWSDVYLGNRGIFALSGTSLFVCGSGIDGRLGTGSTGDLTTLTPITGNWSRIILSEFHPYYTTFALSANTNNRWFVTGNNSFGQLGVGSTASNITTLTLLTGSWDSIVPGGTYNVAISGTRMFVTGNNSNGQLGTSNKINLSAFTPLTGSWNRAVIGNNSILALSGVRIFGTGNNSTGQIGLGSTTEVTTFTLLTGTWNNIYSYNNSSYALSSNGSLFATGNNTSGQLGLGDTSLRTTFTLVTSVTGGISNILSDGNTTLLGRPITLVPVTSAVTTDNTIVRRWNDKSGNNRFYRSAVELGAVSGPVYVSNALNGLGVLRFNGTLQSLFASVSAKTVFNSVNGYSLFCVRRIRSWVGGTNNVSHSLLHFSKNSGTGALRSRVNYGRTYSRITGAWDFPGLGLWTTNNDTASTQTYDERVIHPWSYYPLSGYALDSFEANLATGVANVDVSGAQEMIRSDHFGLLNTGLPSISATLGGFSDGTGVFDGELAEILIYDKILSTTEKIRVENYLMLKWGLSANNIYPYIDGNFSNTSIWSRGRKPRVTDNIQAGNRTVIIDQNVTARSISNYPYQGKFEVYNNGIIIDVSRGSGISADYRPCINCYTAGSDFLTVIGTVSGGWVTTACGIDNISTGGVSVLTTGGVIGRFGPGIRNSSFGTIYVTGPVFGNGAGSDVNTYPAVRDIPATERQSAISITTSRGSYLEWTFTGGGIFNNSSGVIDVVGNVYGGVFASGIVQNPTIWTTMYVTGTLFGGPGGTVSNGWGYKPTFAIETYNYHNQLFLTCNFVYHNTSGNSPVTARNYLLAPKPYASATTFATSNPLSAITYNAVDNHRIYLHPEAKDVQFGVEYGALSISGISVQLKGAMFIPDRTTVEYGTAVGTTVGVGIVSVNSLQNVWNSPLTNIKIPNSVGRRVANTAMISDLGNLLTKHNV